MQEKIFEEINAARWREFDALLTAAEKNFSGVDLTLLPELLQRQSSDLALARHRMYGANMCEYLNDQVIRGYKLVQRENTGLWARVMSFFLKDFPRAMRKEWRLHVLGWLVCLVPALLIIFSSGPDNMEWVNSVLDEPSKMQMESMYGKDTESLKDGRGDGGDFMMFGFYIWNNISIDFQIFACGVLFGLGSLYFLFHNALFFGAIIAYISAYGAPEKLYGFVSSHAPPELWAMVISGMAGMKLGFCLLTPGRRSRPAALLHAGKTAVPLIMGAAAMTLLAAFIEGFWSANEFESLGGWRFKVWVGIAGWIAFFVYFMFCGREKNLET